MARQQNASRFGSFGIRLSRQTGNIVATVSRVGPLQGRLLPCAVERIGLWPLEAHEHQEWLARCGQRAPNGSDDFITFLQAQWRFVCCGSLG
jgi:hypothetical protein